MSDTFDFSQAKRGPILDPKGKTRITIMLDDDVLQAFRERAASEGKGYQTLINEALRKSLKAGQAPDIAGVLKQISEFLVEEKALRQKENAVFANTIADASEAFGSALYAAEHTSGNLQLSRQELDEMRRAVSVTSVIKKLVEATQPADGLNGVAASKHATPSSAPRSAP
ncbi:BrnA antitoxin family protein [Paraburkholderia sp. Ac-20340]|uniref:BrnA antitoxin family protein n=1 Tax=Paraburkholderia sp. Ac-20340 TaxID=2703888 RepID=UPI001980DA78|nr:BrnA antitoxin family protein [Paraburkholderia sp. Ac-20340]MBN3858419.1 BrnA antitoxin family protein [Paraburkholderia sp. Ac-20340]